MSGYVETPTKGFTAGAAISQFLRVVLTSNKLAVAGAEEQGIGTIEEPTAADLDKATVRLWNAQGTRKMVSAGAAAKHALAYGAAGGKVNDVPNGNLIGVYMEAASGDGSTVEILPINAGGSGLKIRAGEATLDGTNPTPVITGLASIVAAHVCQKKATTPGDDPTALTYDTTDGTLNIYAWKTDGSDPTLVASTNNAAVIGWIAIGV